MTRSNTGHSFEGDDPLRNRVADVNRLFRLLIGQNPEQIWLLGRDGSILYTNHSPGTVPGNTPDEPRGKDFLQQFHPDDVPQAACMLQKLLEHPGATITSRLRVHRKANEWVWIECCATNFLNNPDVQAVVVNSRDIAERMEAESDLRWSMDRFGTIFEESPLGMAIADRNCRLVQVNPAFCRQTGYSAEELLQKTSLDLTHPEDRQRSRAADLLVLDGEQKTLTFEKRHITKAGELVEVQITTTLCHGGNREFEHGEHGEPRMLSIVENLAERRKAQQALRDSEATARMLFELNPQPACVFDRRTLRILAVNPAATAAYGYTENEFLSLSLGDLRAPGESGVQEGGPNLQQHRNKDGTVLLAEVVAHELAYEGAKAGLWIIRDVSGKPEAAAHLRQSRNMEAVGLVAAGLAHDFNNVLGVIGGYCAQLSAKMGPGGSHREGLSQIADAAERASSLSRELLKLGGQTVWQPKIVDLNKVIRDMSSFLALLVKGGVELELDLDAAAQFVRVDRLQWERVLMNLVINASDAMPRGGRVKIETASSRSGPYVVQTVSDTGSGIDQAVLSHIFEPFFTTKEAGKGSGLGLANVAAIVKRSGGSVEVSSKPGMGSTFKIHLPVATGAAAAEGGAS